MWRECVREIERVITALAIDAQTRTTLDLPDGADAAALGIAAFTSGTGPLLGVHVEAGRLIAEPAVRALLALHLAHGRRRAERQTAALAAVLDVLTAAGIVATVVKGAHTAHGWFPEPAARPAADIDLVVPPVDRERAGAALAAAGYVPTVRQSRPYKCDWVPPGMPAALRSMSLAHGDAPFAIEMHDSLERVFYGVRTVTPGVVDERTTEPWPALHPGARALSQPLLAAFLATHASEELHQIQLVKLLELALVLRADAASGALEWNGLADLLDGSGATRFAYPAFALADRLVPGTLDPAFRKRITAAATPRIRRFVDRLRPADAQRLDRLSLEERFLWARGPIEFVRRAAYLIWPRHAGRSVRPIRTVYVERLYRILRGDVSLRDRP